MQLVEKYVIDRSDPRYAAIDEAAFKSKNLYNAGNYEIRQSYILHGKVPQLQRDGQAYAVPRSVQGAPGKSESAGLEAVRSRLGCVLQSACCLQGRPFQV